MAIFKVTICRDADTCYSSAEMERTDEAYEGIIKTIDDALKGNCNCVGLNTENGLTIIPSEVLKQSTIHIINL